MSAFRAELTKIRSLRSTYWTLAAAFALSLGLGALASFSMRDGFDRMTPDRQADFDPTVFGFYGLAFGQLALVVFGVLAVTGEYSGGTIRMSLVATPRRGRFLAAKVLAVTSVAAAFSLVTVPVLFAVSQWGLGPHGADPGDPGVPRAIAGACLYMVLMCALATGVAAMLRGTALTLGIMIPLLFLNGQGLASIPAVRRFTQYLPDQAGYVMMGTRPEGGMFGPSDFGPWTALAILLAWTAAALAGGLLTLERRDA
ncbi:ABC transporter permease [Actinomadura kijaniata]|uniref:ABC transporter permease n=1 Tax=Actinomadura kijaniata TaxID=46161 RepID=UPI00082F37F6|nr:ABC transporter permease subunit [Actinomadura kijaniata]